LTATFVCRNLVLLRCGLEPPFKERVPGDLFEQANATEASLRSSRADGYSIMMLADANFNRDPRREEF
jgi:hypothetical protein